MPKYSEKNPKGIALYRLRALTALRNLPPAERRQVFRTFCPLCLLSLEVGYEHWCPDGTGHAKE